MTSLREMNERQNQWMNEKPSFDNGLELRTNKDDVVIAQFMSTGSDGDLFIKNYRSHIYNLTGKNGKPYSRQVYCPLRSGDDTIHECPSCAAGHSDIKERFSVWFYVFNHLHHQLPQEKNFPLVMHEGAQFFNEEVNAFKLWHTSGWKDSPWQDIVRLESMYEGLHNFTASLVTYGEGLQRRFKVFPMPRSAFVAPETYEAAKTNCEPLIQILRNQIGTAVATNPQAQMPQQQAPIPFQSAAVGQAPPRQVATAWTPPGASPAPAFTVPGMNAQPQAAAPAPVNAPPAPTPATAPEFTPPLTAPLTATVPVQEENAQAQVEEGEERLAGTPAEELPAPDEDTRRPLRSMF